MGKLSELLNAPPPPSYEIVARHKRKSNLPCGLDAALWTTIFSWSVHPKRLSKEDQAMGWADLHKNVRFACKDFYMVCMHLLRSQYLSKYSQKIRAPFTSDPYPSGEAITNSHIGRETRILDLFIAAQVRSDVEIFESTLLESTLGDDEEGENDLFQYHQPKARIEDLVISLGNHKGIISNNFITPPTYSIHQQIDPINFSIELKHRSITIRLRSSPKSAFKTKFEIQRMQGESLESLAHNIFSQLTICIK